MTEDAKLPIDDLMLDPRNARRGNVESIAESLREFGQHRRAVVQRDSMKVIAGNHMVMAAQLLGWTHVDCVLVDDDDATAIRRGIADNATGDQAKWNDDMLTELLKEVGTDIPGLDEKLVNRLFKELEEDLSEPKLPIMARPGEGYPYILFFGESELDDLWLKTMWPERERLWKRPKNAAIWSRIRPLSELRRVIAVGDPVGDAPKVVEFELTDTPEPTDD